MPIEELFLIFGAELAIVREALVVIVRDQVENVFFEVGAGPADRVNLLLADHLGERQTEFGRAHRAGQRHEHLPALVEVAPVSIGRVDERPGVEVPVMVTNEFADLAHD